MLVVNRHNIPRTQTSGMRDAACWRMPLISFHSLSPLISLGFWGNALFNPPYVAEVYTRYSTEFGVHIRQGGEKKAYIYTVEWCNLHEIPVNRERKPSGAVD